VTSISSKTTQTNVCKILIFLICFTEWKTAWGQIDPEEHRCKLRTGQGKHIIMFISCLPSCPQKSLWELPGRHPWVSPKRTKDQQRPRSGNILYFITADRTTAPLLSPHFLLLLLWAITCVFCKFFFWKDNTGNYQTSCVYTHTHTHTRTHAHTHLWPESVEAGMRHTAHHCDAEHLLSTPTVQQKTARRTADGKLLTSYRETGRRRWEEVRKGNGVKLRYTNITDFYNRTCWPSSSTQCYRKDFQWDGCI